MSDRIKHEVVCIGTTQATGSKKLIPHFREVVDGILVGEPFAWGGVKASPGNVYQVESDVPWSTSHEAYVPKSGRLPWLRQWPDAEQRAEWEAQARLAQTAKTYAAMQADAERQDEVKLMCAPLSRVYHSLPYRQRTAFLVMVQELIVRNRPKKDDDNAE